MLPLLKNRAEYPWWRVGIGFFWVPAIIIVVTAESMAHLDSGLIWLSLGVLFVAFMGYLLFWD